MFEDRDEARDALKGNFDAAQLEAVLAALVPAIVFEPLDPDEDAVGGTRLGGAPDLPPGAAWPRPPAPEDPEALAGRGSAEAGASMRRHLAEGLPYAFMAQVDLAEAAALGPVAADLPPDGRLLFFYDYATGPWDAGTRCARVVWDRAPREDLRPAVPPGDLAAAAARERAELGQAPDAAAPKSRTSIGPPPNEATIYGAPGRPMRLDVVLRLPHPASVEMESLPDLAALYRGEERGEEAEAFRDAYDEALEEHDSFDFDRGRHQQLLGSPMPEQDEPRHDAVVVTVHGRQHLEGDDRALHREAVSRDARNWRLLLQIDLGDWAEDEYGEGTVYFLIRADDLARRHFDGTVAVYQQT